MGRTIRTIREEQAPSVQATIDELTQKANSFLEKNDLGQAYPYVCRLADTEQAEPATSLTAGLMALTLGKRDEAGKHFRQALRKAPDDFNANYNIALIEISGGNYDEAAAILSRLVELNPENAALHNDLAVVWMNKKDTQQALQSFERALELDPNYTAARGNAMQFILDNRLFVEGKHILQVNTQHSQVSNASIADIKKWEEAIGQSSINSESVGVAEEDVLVAVRSSHDGPKGKRLAFFASQPTFIQDIIKRLSNENETRLFAGQTAREIVELMQWADAAWFEWCDHLIIEATKHSKQCQIVCRLHSYEAFTDMPTKVDWGKVDRLIFVNDSVKEIFERQVRIDTPVTIIHNGLDISRFSIPTKKGYGKKIASVGYINYKKNPALLLYCFKKIHAYDPEYTLHIAGQHQDARIQVYFEHFLRENPLPVKFHGWVEDMPAWYADKDFIISTSLFESFHYSVAEGMASGLLPLIHNWCGAGSIYPEGFLFNDPDGCLNLLQRLESADKHKLAQENRRFIVQHYNQEDKFQQIAKLLESLTKSST